MKENRRSIKNKKKRVGGKSRKRITTKLKEKRGKRVKISAGKPPLEGVGKTWFETNGRGNPKGSKREVS